MIRWVKAKIGLMGLSVLLGLVIALGVNFYQLSRPAFGQASSIPVVVKGNDIVAHSVINDSYWKGRIDEKLAAIQENTKTQSDRMEKLSSDLVELRVGAARDGAIYGSVSSILVFLGSMFVQGAVRKTKNGLKLPKE